MPKIRAARVSTIRVKQKHIDDATRKDSQQCAIAQAIQDSIPTAAHISVDIQAIRWSDLNRGVRYTYLTPPAARNFLLKFDEGKRKELKPFPLKLSEGYTKPAGWKANHPNTRDRSGATYRKTGIKRMVPARQRRYGMRELVSVGG